jgi:succinoglycan biosynthesis transport protein ExoP
MLAQTVVAPNYKDAIGRRLKLSLTVGLILVAIASGLAIGLPSYYKSRAVVLIEAQEIPQDLVRSLVTSYADQRIQVISQRVLTNSNLTTIIEKYDLYAAERRKDPLEFVLEQMRKDISVTPISADVVDPKQGRATQATIAFEIAYESRAPQLAQRVANELVSLFLNENLKQRTETSTDTLEFLNAEAERERSVVSELESKLAAFKTRNLERLPELNNFNLELMNRAEQDIGQLDGQLQSLNQQRVYLESELAQQKPNTLVLSETGERILSPADRLKVLESEFIPLAARYGVGHPDVISKKREIDALRVQVGGSTDSRELSAKLEKAKGELSSAQERYSSEHPDVKRFTKEVNSLESQLASSANVVRLKVLSTSPPDNPAYIQLQARLDATIADIQSIQSQRAARSKKLASLEDRVTRAPEVEREYRMLSRDYETAQAKYQEVLAKRQEAELASNLESKQRGERFTLIEPPVTPETPTRPNRLAVVFVGIVLSLGGGVGAGAVAESFDNRVHGRAGVIRLLGVAPLAVIPRIDTDGEVAVRRKRRLVASGILALIVISTLLCLHFLVSPLDVLYFRVLHKLGF